MAFEARYPGTCYDCGGYFEAGTMIEYAAGGDGEATEWRHEVCLPILARIADVCPRCFLELPATGVCAECE